MKAFIKISMISTYSMLLICSASYAMDYVINITTDDETELVPLTSTTGYNSFQTTTPLCSSSKTKPLKNPDNYDNFQINTIDEIPKLPLEKIGERFKSLPTTKQNQLLATKNKNYITLAESLPFNIARFLPKEVQLHILRLLMDNDEPSAQLFYNTPLWYAYTRYYNAKKKIQKLLTKTNMDPVVDAIIIYIRDPLPTDQSISLFFRSSKDTQKKIINNLQPSRKPIDEGRIIIDESQQKEILSFDSDIQKTFFADKNIIIMTKDERSNVATSFGIVSVTGAMGGLACGAIIALIGGITTGNPLWGIVPPCVGVLGGGISGGFIGQLFYVRDARDNAQKLVV